MDSYFEKGVVLTGTLWVKGNVHFGAHLTGDLHSNDHLVIGQWGYVKGDIHSYDLSNGGKVEGNIFSENKTALLKGGQLTGDISTYQLVVDEGADFGGRCKMVDAPHEQKVREPLIKNSPDIKNFLKQETKTKKIAQEEHTVASIFERLILFSRFPKLAGILK